MEDHKQYLNDNADEDERRAAAQVMEGLAGLRLEAKVREVAAERAALHRRVFWQRIFISTIALALIAGAVYLFFGKKDASTPAQAPPTQQRTAPLPPPEQQHTPPEVPKEKTIREPIAQLRPAERLPNPRYPAPEVTMIRGDGGDNKALKSLLDQIWYTDYPLRGVTARGVFEKADENLKKRDFTAVYIELDRLAAQHADNDTLRYLKGYCLMEMGEGTEALMYFNSLQGRHAVWEPQLQWYGGLALLLTDDRDKAKALFKQIAAQAKHPYQRQAEKAVDLMMNDE